MARGAEIGVAAGVALILLLGPGTPASAQGPAGRRPAGGLVVVDDDGREVGPVIGLARELAVAGLIVDGAVVPVEVAADRILAGLASVVFTTPTCQGTAFLLPGFALNGTNGSASGPTGPGLFVAGGIGPGNLLLRPKGAKLKALLQSRWDSAASPPQCRSFLSVGETDVFAAEVALDLGVFQAPFHLRRP